MSKKFLFLLPLLSAAPLFLAGALRRPVPDAAASFSPQTVPLAPDLVSADAATLFDRALDRIGPEKVRWLKVHLRQHMETAETAFDAEGTLQLGPDRCARLEMNVNTGGKRSRSLVVSDGHAVAQATESGSGPPNITTGLLGDRRLEELGCGGPYPLLKELRNRLASLKAEIGLLQRRPVVRIGGRLAKKSPGADAMPPLADFCYLYLDAQSLWPGRLEWWGSDAKQNARPVLAMEFTDPEVNRALSLDECVRVFSYRPD